MPFKYRIAKITQGWWRFGFSGQNKNDQEKVRYLDNKRRHETAFSATCPTVVYDIDKDKKIKKVSTRPYDTVKASSTDHQKSLNKHKVQEQIMQEVNLLHKTILDYTNHSHKNMKQLIIADTIIITWLMKILLA